MSEQVHEEERREGNGHDAEKQPEPRKDPKKARRNKIIAIAAVSVALVIGLVWWLHARHFEDTDDAQIDGNITAVSSRVPGTVVAVHVDDNQNVTAGALLIELDPSALQISLSQGHVAV